uniref:Uncharacterized protein n=1 Tax=Rhizophora mucronata TaxID=61149 RepID=A0A2P2IUK0_RHIMU
MTQHQNSELLRSHSINHLYPTNIH